jgi:hypothetical protein
VQCGDEEGIRWNGTRSKGKKERDKGKTGSKEEGRGLERRMRDDDEEGSHKG